MLPERSEGGLAVCRRHVGSLRIIGRAAKRAGLRREQCERPHVTALCRPILAHRDPLLSLSKRELEVVVRDAVGARALALVRVAHLDASARGRRRRRRRMRSESPRWRL